MSVERTIQRLLTVFGEPKTDSPDLYLEEFAKAIAGFADEFLNEACDAAIRECTFFPRPAEIRERAYRISAKYAKPNTPDHFKPDPVIEKDEASKERVREMLKHFNQAVAARSMEQALKPERVLSRKELAAGERE